MGSGKDNAAKQDLKVSFCTTCKGRVHHLKETLPKNLAATKDNPNVEFVLLDYDSRDGMEAWVKENFQSEITSGRLRYAKLAPAEHFKMAHAKNMVHRIATGDILCNLDADNVIGKGYAEWLAGVFRKHPSSIVSQHAFTPMVAVAKRIDHKFLHRDRPKIGGRIAVMRDDFYRLGGYDEKYSGWSPDDMDFTFRGRELGLKRVDTPVALLGEVIDHSNEERLSELSPEDQETSGALMARHPAKKAATVVERTMRRRTMVANPSGEFGCGTVEVNFSGQPTELKPLQPTIGYQYEQATGRPPLSSGQNSR